MKCDYCAESIPDDSEECPSCGELLVDDGPADTGSGAGKIILIIAVVLVFTCVCGGGLLATLMMPALMKAKEKANRTKCANNMRMLGLGAIQYSDDKRFFPHVEKTLELDGDIATNHTPKKIRTLLYYGYLDRPEDFICPSSFDVHIPRAGGGSVDGRNWFWDFGANPDPSLSPLVDGADDPTLDETNELSYGWTRRGMNSNVRSTAKLSADRAVREGGNAQTTTFDTLIGNHEQGRNVLSADATVSYTRWPDDGSLVATEGQNAGYLTIKEQ